jgi:DNA polymerase-3 subunit gamma/tau
MDAASNTGVGDVREIIDSVRYRAASARYKVYIIDEVHMLSTSAFNALLKTLEEPPEHVKFIFATTEIRKVPVTVLSRCQRFDLRRIEPEEMIGMLRRIAEAEGAEIEDGALALIARAAEGSARDATSLLDQAIGHGEGATSAEQVRAMLGLADRGRVLDLFERIMQGAASEALEELSAQYAEGADPMAVLRDLAEITHWISVVKVTPGAADDPTVAPEERRRGQDLAARLPMRTLTRTWQMLLKALEEVAIAPNAMMAAEMAVIRLTHVAELPSPEELLRRLQDQPPPPGPGGPTPGGGNAPGTAAPVAQRGPQTTHAPSGGPHAALQPAPDEAPQTLWAYPRFEDVVELIRAQGELKLLYDVEHCLRLAAYRPGRIEAELTPDAPERLIQDLAGRLHEWTGARWSVTVVNEGGGATLAEARETALMTHPLMQAVQAAFPQAKVTAIRPLTKAEDAAGAEALPEVEDEWDPFEED